MWALKKLAIGLRFRLTLSYALFFVLMLAVVGLAFRAELSRRLDENTREVLEEEWAALKGYLHIQKGKVDWVYDREDNDENRMVSRLRFIYLLADSSAQILQYSEAYQSLGFDSTEEIRAVLLKSPETPTYRRRNSPELGPILLRAGVVLEDEKPHSRYFVAVGRSLAPNEEVLKDFTRIYLTMAPAMILGGCLLGWFVAGSALRPVTQVASAANTITGSNLTLRIPERGAGDELDYLIETFNRMIERLDRSFQQVRQFSTDVSHELRTPLTAVRGQLEVALFTARSEDDYRNAIVDALQDIERLSQIVRALLLLSQAETGQVALQKTPQNLSEVVNDIIDQFQIPAEEAAIRLTASAPPMCMLDFDRIQVERLISNLISNAVKFTPKGGQVQVSVVPVGSTVEIRVEDTGCGISPEHLPHIFERFYQVRNVPAAERGMGLGLSFVDWIARAHGGSVGVKSEVGKGTCFVVRLPSSAEIPQPAPAMNEV